jgi:hypothetical protein
LFLSVFAGNKITKKMLGEFFLKIEGLDLWIARGEPRGPKGTRWRAHYHRARHLGPFSPQSSPRLPPSRGDLNT